MGKKIKLKSNNHGALLGLISILLLYVLWISKIFIVPIITAAILAYVSFPVFKKFKQWTNKPRFSAFVTLFFLTTLFLVPLVAVMIIISNQTINFLANFRVSELFSSLNIFRDNINAFLDLNLTQTDFEGILINGVSRLRQFLISYSFRILNGITNAIFQIFFILIFMFYFFTHGKKVYSYIFHLLPFSDENKNKLKTEIQKDVKALILGQGLIAIIEGLIMSIGFLIFGIPNVLTWGFVTIIASFVPIIGIWITWVPATLYLLINNHPFFAIGLALWGLIISSNIDSFLRPVLVQSMSKINFLVVLVGAIIGLRTFGVIGFVLGPLILAILITLFKIYLDEETTDTTKAALKNNKPIA